MKTEIVIWGKDKNHSDETLLITGLKSIAEANAAMKKLREYGCYDFRVSSVDLTTPPDFGNKKLINL